MLRPSISESHKLPSIQSLLVEPLPQGDDLPMVQFAPESGGKTNTRITEIEVPFTPTPENPTSARMPTGNPPSKSTSSQQTNKKPKCEIFSKAYERKGNFVRHMLIHTVEERFRCDICTKPLTSEAHLKRHMRTHAGKKSFKCTVDGCAKAVKPSVEP